MATLKQFEILGKLGEGAFATVYKAKRKQDSKQYALKKIKFSTLGHKEISNCLNQVRILASINSPYIIGYKDAFFDEISKSLCIITQFAQGGDLYHKIQSLKKKNQFIEQNEVWRLAIQMIHALKVLHNLKIFHRDLKTANIFLTKDYQNIKIGDLNVSIVSKNGMAYTQTGTPYYACPEVWNDKPYNSKSDIWSLGCVLYQMCAQKPPFSGNDMQGLCKRINKGVYDRIPSKYSDDLATLINMCLKIQPNERPSCETLLKHNLIRKKIHLFPNEQFNRDLNVEEFIDLQNNRLLETIKAPRNINFRQLKQKLPRSNYDSKESKQNRSVSLGKNEKNKTQTDEPVSSSRNPLSRIQNLPELKRVSSANRQYPVKIRQQFQLKNNLSVLVEDRPPLPNKKKISIR